jgi:hypothetical protein
MRILLSKPYLLFTILFVASRACFHAAGQTFFAWHASMMHFVDLQVLQADVWQTLWYLHGQPPLMSVFLASVLAPVDYDYSRSIPIFRSLFLIGGLVLGWAWIHTLMRAGLRPLTSVAVAVGFSLLPACIVYERYLFYTYPVVVLLALMGMFMIRAIQAPGFRTWTWVFLLAAILALFKGVFHLAWMLGLVGILWRLSARKDRRVVLVASILPLLLVAGWYGKNLALHGQFKTSSWVGIGLARKTYHLLPAEERAALARRIDPIIGVDIFGSVAQFAEVVPMPEPTGVRLLDEPSRVDGSINFHHAIYVEGCDRMVAAAWQSILEDPRPYARNVLETIQLMFEPASLWWPVVRPRNEARVYCTAVDLLLHGHWGVRGINCWSVLTLVTLLGGGVVSVRSLRRPAEAQATDALITAATFTAVFILAVSALFDAQEANRHRFLVDGVIVLAAVLLACRWRRPAR